MFHILQTGLQQRLFGFSVAFVVVVVSLYVNYTGHVPVETVTICITSLPFPPFIFVVTHNKVRYAVFLKETATDFQIWWFTWQ